MMMCPHALVVEIKIKLNKEANMTISHQMRKVLKEAR